jgi:hypothetical protein
MPGPARFGRTAEAKETSLGEDFSLDRGRGGYITLRIRGVNQKGS